MREFAVVPAAATEPPLASGADGVRSSVSQGLVDLVIAEPRESEVAASGASNAELTPAQLQLRRMVLDSVTSIHSRRNDAKALDLLFGLAAGRPLTRALLLE